MSLEHFESICGTHSVLMYAELEAEVSVFFLADWRSWAGHRCTGRASGLQTGR